MNSVALSAGMSVAWAVLFLGVLLVLAYRRAGLGVSCVVLGVLLLSFWMAGTAPDWWKVTLSIPYALLLLLNIRPLRLRALTRPFMRSYRRLLPPIPTITGTRPAALSYVKSAICFFSSLDRVGVSPVVPSVTTYSAPPAMT